MTKKELIDALKDCPDNTPVVIGDLHTYLERKIHRIEFLKLIIHHSASSKDTENMDYIKLVVKND